MTTGAEKFGAFIRREREARDIGLREMAKKIGVSPTYLSKVERDEFTPPIEEKVRAIATIIECDPDKLLGMAGRVPADVANIIKRYPVALSRLLRKLNSLSPEELGQLMKQGGIDQMVHDAQVRDAGRARAARSARKERQGPARKPARGPANADEG